VLHNESLYFIPMSLFTSLVRIDTKSTIKQRQPTTTNSNPLCTIQYKQSYCRPIGLHLLCRELLITLVGIFQKVTFAWNKLRFY
jgi:hypothetical protein